MNKQLSSFKYIIGLGVLLLVLFRIGHFIEYLFIKIFHIPYGSLSVGIAGIIVQAAAFIVAIGVGLKYQRKTLASVCFFKKVNAGVWGAAILCSIGYTLFNFYICFLFASFKYGWNTDYDVTGGNFFINLIDNAVIPAVAEELLIKGLVFTFLRKHFSVILAVIIASFMFSALHLSFLGFIPHFLFAIYTFWIYLRSGSLILPMLLHFINNLFADVLISDPFASLGTFYAGLVLFGAGSYLLHILKNQELENLAKDEK